MGSLSVLAAFAFLSVTIWIFAVRPYVIVIAPFFLFAAAWRIISSAYIDFQGPVYSHQLYRMIGPGASAVPLVLVYLSFLLCLLVSFRPQRLRSILANSTARLIHDEGVQRLALALAGIFTLLLWCEMLMRGNIAFFSGLERYEYTERYGGPLHRILMEYAPMYSLLLGMFWSNPILRNRSPDHSFLILMGMLLIYLFLAGHRFSAFYKCTGFFVIPVGIVLIWIWEHQKSSIRRVFLLGIAKYVAAAILAVSLLISLALYHSYAVVRSSGETSIQHRVLVQQGEMWWLTYERIFLQDQFVPEKVAHWLFVNPPDPQRNTTIQYLMAEAIPDKFEKILQGGTQYAGGFPEIMFELGGPVGGFFLAIIFFLVLSEYLFLFARYTLEGRYLSAALLAVVLYTLSVTFIGGMLNSYIAWTFVVKVSVTAVVLYLEAKWRKHVCSNERDSAKQRNVYGKEMEKLCAKDI